MSLRLFLGRAGTGKTERMFRELHAQVLAKRVGHPLLYIVPEQATFQAEYRLATLPDLGGTIRAQALSFARLSYRLMQDAGGQALTPVNEIGKQMVLRMLLERHRDQLQAFQRAALQPGFVGQLARMISECKTYGINAEALGERDWGDGTLAGKMHDLCLLLNAYDGYLADRYLDSDEMLSRMSGSIAQSDWIRDAEIWIDGFSGFTHQELIVISQLMLHARRVTVALCLDPDDGTDASDELALFYPTRQTCERLQALAADAGVTIEEPVIFRDQHRLANSPQLGHLEKHYFAWDTPTDSPQPGREQELTLYTAVNRRAEVQAVALQMLALARSENYRFREMAVLLRSMDEYADELASVFAEYDIPFFLDQKRSVLHHPLIELVRSGLEAVFGRWKYEALFRCFKTDLLAPPQADVAAARLEVDLLENYVLAYGIQGHDWAKEQEWSFHGESVKGFEEIDRIRRTYGEPLLALDRAIKRAERADVRTMVRSLYDWLMELEVPTKLEGWQEQAQAAGDLEAARQHGQVWNGVMELFDQIVEVMGEEQMEIATFARVMDSGLEGIQLGMVPPSLNQVLVGSMERSRQPDFVKALFILGVNDGIIPLRPKEDGILDEAERDRVTASGIELAPSARQRLLAEQFLLYQAVTRPTERLFLSCALADEEGKALLPSLVFDRIKELFPQLPIRFFHNEPSGDKETDALLLGRPRQVFTHLLTLARQLKKGAVMPPFWREVYDWFLRHSTDAERERWLLSGFSYTNQPKALSASASRGLYGEQLRMSVSRLERFQACPFSHFASHGLRLKERLTYRLERFDVGELFHASLKRAVDKMNEERLDWSSLTETGSMQLAGEVVEELIPETRSSILNRTARYRYLTGKLKRAVGRAIYVLGEHAKRSQFVPVGLEIGFGPGEELPGLSLELIPGVTVQLVGRIDRVDQSIAEDRLFLRVIDYKSGPKKLQLSDVWNGLNLQLLVYLDVVVTNAPEWLGRPAEVGGVFYYQVADPFITEKRALTADEVAKERSSRLKMKGYMLADAELVKRMDEQVETGASDLFAVGFKKDGSFTSRSAVATAEQFQQLQRYVRKQVRELGTSMVNGEIAIAPFVLGQMSACNTCAYKAVCQFDSRMAGNLPRQLSAWQDRDVWTMLQHHATEGGEESHG